MTWTPKFQTRFIETPRKAMTAIATRDLSNAITYYNTQSDATVQLVPFAKVVNTRFYDLFFSRRFEDFPVLIISAAETDAPEENDRIDGKYSLMCEVWIVGPDPVDVRTKLERYATVVAMMFVAASPADYATGNQSRPTVTVGKHKYGVIRARGPNDYQDKVEIPLTLTYVEG